MSLRQHKVECLLFCCNSLISHYYPPFFLFPRMVFYHHLSVIRTEFYVCITEDTSLWMTPKLPLIPFYLSGDSFVKLWALLHLMYWLTVNAFIPILVCCIKMMTATNCLSRASRYRSKNPQYFMTLNVVMENSCTRIVWNLMENLLSGFSPK